MLAASRGRGSGASLRAPPEETGIGAGIKPEIFPNGDALVEVVAGA
jgi:hypothetical protein